MTVNFTFNQMCDFCHSFVTYTDEVPVIYTDRTRVIRNNRANNYVAQVTNTNTVMPDGVEPFIDNMQIGYKVSELPIKYTICPVCQGRIYMK